ncbi:MAG TPA: ABC transporter permease [Desulfocapsa sulfexigens]|nr:ABC transporter permease [Desulfocapsa sulfexigens]HIQ37862.1 ABC transporter permease [Desulfocapsa sulfexigens]
MTENQPILAKPIAFFKRDFKIATSYRLNFITQGFGIILSTFSFFLLSKMFDGQHIAQLEPYGGDYFSFVLIGIALTDYLTSATNTFATEIRTAQIVGTLESLLVTPTSITTILLSSYFYKLVSTSLRILIYFLVGVFLFGIQLQPVNLFALIITFCLTLLPFFGLGLLSASFILVFKQGNPIASLLAMSSGLLAGAIYPVAILPNWLKPFSDVLPITHGLEAMRQILLNGAGLQDINKQLLYLSLLTIVFLTTGLGAIYFGLKIAKKEGSLLHY